jgi:BirA family biotin operon repressor/biotin-[acetyl-CoA-carboxylase] ligase
MRQLAVHNPFNAPVYHEETVGSTMEISQSLARQGNPHGTVISADFQEAGRGRIEKRLWDMERGAGLPFTILLRYPRAEDIPAALTLRAGLAAASAIECFAPAIAGRVMIKWPNDIMILPAEGGPDAPAKKAAGILAEADGGNLHIGIGVNVSQREFPPQLADKATSIGIASDREIAYADRFALLEKILACLYAEVEVPDGLPECSAADGAAGTAWEKRITEKLYKKGQHVSFAAGAADSPNIITGILSGIGPGGELLVLSTGISQSTDKMLSFTSGELLLNRDGCHEGK